MGYNLNINNFEGVIFMFHMLKRASACLFLSMSLISTCALATEWKEWDVDSTKLFPADKVWTIDFSLDVDESSIDDQSIYVLDSNDEVFDTKKSTKDSDSIEVRPIKEYSSGEIYRLFISDDLLSSSGSKLSDRVFMTFEIESSEPSSFDKAIQDSLRSGAKSLDIYDYEIHYTDLSEKINKIVDEDPLILYYDGYSASYDSNTGIAKTINFEYKIDPSDINDKRETVLARANEILNSLDLDGQSDYEKAVAVHDYLVENIIYDSEGFDSGDIEADQYSMYGALVENSAVCEGYAEAFLYFMNELNVDCKRVTGLGNGGDHAWNLVNIDGQWYHLDATFDDPVPDRGDYVTRIYLLTNDDRMSITHDWDSSDYPKADSLDSYYFRKEGLEAKTREEFKALVKSLYTSGSTDFDIWCSNFDSETYDLDLIVEALREMNYNKSFRRSINSEFGIIHLEL